MFLFKSVKPATKFKSSVFRSLEIEAARAFAPTIEKELLRPTATWKGDKPKFKSEVKVGNAAGGALAKKATGSASGVSIETTTDNKVYGYLDQGTDVRFATMSSDFISKTRTNDLRAYRGRGRRLFINRNRPRPGIKARGFVKLAKKNVTPAFRKAMQASLDKGAAASGHSMKP